MFDNGNVRHCRRARRAVPMLLLRWAADHVTGPNFHDRTSPALDQTAARRDDQGLAQRMGVPMGPCAGLEGDTRGEHAGRIGSLVQRVNADRATKILSWPFARRLCTASFDVHSVTASCERIGKRW